MTKSLLFCCSLFAIAVSGLQAQLVSQYPLQKDLPGSFINTNLHTEQLPDVPLQKDRAEPQAVTFVNVYNMDLDAPFELYNGMSNFMYDPTTKALIIARSVRTFENSQFVGGRAFLVVSTDVGATWAQTQVYGKTGVLMAWLSLSLNNIGNSQTLQNLSYTVSGFTYEQATGWGRGPTGMLIKTTSDPYDFTIEGPDVNNSALNEWGSNRQIAVGGDNPTTVAAGLLNVSSSGQYGTYGVWAFDMQAEDFAASSIPTKWDVNQFRNPGSLTGSFNGRMTVGADEEGRIYSVVNNLFADDQDNRVPAVSVSEDQGRTWTDFARMPVSLYAAYAATHSLNPVGVYGSYSQNGIVVTGRNQFSYFFRVFSLNEAQDQYQNLDLVEAKYNAGTWTLNRVAELNGFPLEFGRQDSASLEDGGEFGYTPFYQLNSHGHEIQAAITADGQSILVKWVDESPELGQIALGKTQKALLYRNGLLVGESQLDTMFTTDVYFSYKAVASGAWSEKVNITRDLTYDKGTRIPPVIPSLTEVPLLECKTVAKSALPNSNFKAAVEQLPDLILDASIDFYTPNIVRVGKFNAINPSSVTEEKYYGFELNSVYPNPTSNEAEITFNVTTGGNVVVEIFNALGSKVATVVDQPMDAGLHGKVIDTALLPAGSYHVALSLNGNRLSQPLVIIK